MCDPVSLDLEWRSFIVHMIEKGDVVDLRIIGMSTSSITWNSSRTFEQTMWRRLLNDCRFAIVYERNQNVAVHWSNGS